jgi:hypothetical protein
MPRLSSLAALALVLASGGAASAQATLSQTPPGQTPVSEAVTSASPFVASAPDDLLASNLIDLEVKDPQGARIGEIEDVVLDPSRAARGVVIGIGGYRGGNVRHVGVALSALQLSRNADGKWQAVLAASPEALKSAPAFSYTSGFNDE